MERRERKTGKDTLYEVLSLESEAERERRKTTASPPQSGSGAPSPPEDEEEEGRRQTDPSLRPPAAHPQIHSSLGQLFCL